MKKTFALFLLCLSSLRAANTPPDAAAPKFNAWITDFHDVPGPRILDTYALRLSEVSVFAAAFDDRRTLLPLSDFIYTAIEKTRRANPRARVLLTVVNDVGETIEKDPDVIHRNVHSPWRRYRHVHELMRLLKKSGADGLDIDYENLRPQDGPDFSLFIEQLARALHARGRYLTVVVEPKTRDAARPADWKALGNAADRLRVLGYNYAYDATPPGAVSPPKKIAELADYALTQVPADKLEIALPLHGYDWPEGKTGRPVNGLGEINERAAKFHVVLERDPDTGAAHFRYTDGQGIVHQVWYEDPDSLWPKIKMLQGKGLSNIGIWELGGGGDLSGLFEKK